MLSQVPPYGRTYSEECLQNMGETCRYYVASYLKFQHYTATSVRVCVTMASSRVVLQLAGSVQRSTLSPVRGQGLWRRCNSSLAHINIEESAVRVGYTEHSMYEGYSIYMVYI